MSKNTIYNPQDLGKLTINLRDAILKIAEEFEAEHGRKSSAGRIYVHIDVAQLAARNAAYKAGNRQDAQAAALAYVADDGALDFKNADIAEAITTVFGEQKFAYPTVAYSKGFLSTKGVKSTTELPTDARVFGRIAPAKPAKEVAKVEAQAENAAVAKGKEKPAKGKGAKAAKNAEIPHENEADDQTH